MGMGYLYPKNTQVHGRRQNNGSAAVLLDGQAPPAGQGFWEPMENFVLQVWDSGLQTLRAPTQAEADENARLDLLSDRGLEDWRAPTMVGGWVNFGGAFDGAGLRGYSRGGGVADA